jgi:hypothetical protein
MNGDVNKSMMKTTATTNTPSDIPTSSNAMHNSTSVPNVASISTLSPTQQRHRQEWLERESQASSLAAAGMVAESVRNNETEPSSSTNYITTTIPVLGLQPPPTIFSHPVQGGSGTTTTSTAVTELDSINWNLMDIGGMHIDDMDMDFATLFDPANELSNLPSPRDATGTSNSTNGWLPNTNSSTDVSSISPTPLSAWSDRVQSAEQQQQQPSQDFSTP